ncbi:MAG: galactose oxidase-like domain-containing protein [Hyphomicrobiales bacterium]
MTITAPSNPNVAVPGYYMLFVFDKTGVPSVAKIVRVLS